jgi:hypothetical protein
MNRALFGSFDRARICAVAVPVLLAAGCYTEPARPQVVYHRTITRPLYHSSITSASVPDVTTDAAGLHALVAPIALYPDPLLAVLLPACTYPGQVSQAAQWLSANPTPSDSLVDAQPWDPSVKALLHYPTVLNQMTADPRWTESLGSAFASEPAAVTRTIQEMRSRAAAVGSLVSTQEATVVQDEEVISIQPAVETSLYVPVYDPVYVYTRPTHVMFKTVYVTGPWLVHGCDWVHGAVFVGPWRGAYVYRRGVWSRNRYFQVTVVQTWHRNDRFGPPPHLARNQYSHPKAMQGHEADFHNRLDKPKSQPPEKAAKSTQPHHPESQKSGGNNRK